MGEISDLHISTAQMRQIIHSSEDLVTALAVWAKAYGVDYVTYHMPQMIVSAVDSVFVRSTYPMAWIGRYMNKGYFSVDQVVQEGMHRTQPFYWADLNWTKAGQDMCADAETYGVGCNGYSIPLVDDIGRKALLSMSSSAPKEQVVALVESHTDAWNKLATDIHQRGLREAYGIGEDVRPLARRERECLYLAAQGKNLKEISGSLRISDYTARGHLTSARLKLKCRNTVHAVAKATKLRIIDPV
ncbi:LuxR family transcriptional regulator [Rhizobium sp.]|uniref:helix-turn-helix transcriptional regulator n=1 Tax=Rhizobium sp. TaxID=391 RepID=UPI002AA759BC